MLPVIFCYFYYHKKKKEFHTEQATIQNVSGVEVQNEGIYSYISPDNIHTIYDTDDDDDDDGQNNAVSATNGENSSNYFMITLESIKTSQDIPQDTEPSDIPDWGEGENMMAYQNATTLMKSMNISQALPNWNESPCNEDSV